MDLIDKLMSLDPAKRLGVGTNLTNDYETLKKHKFFKGINFKKIEETAPPVPPYIRKKIAHQKNDVVVTKTNIEIKNGFEPVG